MKTVVEVFDPEQAKSLSHAERLDRIEKAIAHHAGQLSELGLLLQALFSQEASRHQIDSDYFLPTLRGLIKERYDILDRLEDDYNADEKAEREVIVTRLAAERPGLRALPTRPRQRKVG